MFETMWRPMESLWSEVNRLQDEMERLWRRAGWDGLRPTAGTAYPPLNVWEDDDRLYVEAELPGFELSDLEITVTGENQLSLKGERKRPQEAEGAVWHRQERGYGSFNRVMELPQAVDADRVTAQLKHGVLTITLPKKAEAKPRRIAVKAE